MHQSCFAQASKKQEAKPAQLGSGSDLAETLPFVPEVPDSHPRSDLETSPVQNNFPEFGSDDPFVAMLTKQKDSGSKEGAEEEVPTDDELVEPIITHETVEEEAKRQFLTEQQAPEAHSKAAEQTGSASAPVAAASATEKHVPNSTDVAVEQPKMDTKGIKDSKETPAGDMHPRKKQKVETTSSPANEKGETEGQPKSRYRVADQPADSQPVENEFHEPPLSPTAVVVEALDSDEEEQKKGKRKGKTAQQLLRQSIRDIAAAEEENEEDPDRKYKDEAEVAQKLAEDDVKEHANKTGEADVTPGLDAASTTAEPDTDANKRRKRKTESTTAVKSAPKPKRHKAATPKKAKRAKKGSTPTPKKAKAKQGEQPEDGEANDEVRGEGANGAQSSQVEGQPPMLATPKKKTATPGRPNTPKSKAGTPKKRAAKNQEPTMFLLIFLIRMCTYITLYRR
eukprot:s71_g8.t1